MNAKRLSTATTAESFINEMRQQHRDHLMQRFEQHRDQLREGILALSSMGEHLEMAGGYVGLSQLAEALRTADEMVTAAKRGDLDNAFGAKSDKDLMELFASKVN